MRTLTMISFDVFYIHNVIYNNNNKNLMNINANAQSVYTEKTKYHL